MRFQDAIVCASLLVSDVVAKACATHNGVVADADANMWVSVLYVLEFVKFWRSLDESLLFCSTEFRC